MPDDAADLLAQARALFSATDGRDPAALLDMTSSLEGEYAAMARRAPSAADAETCRLAMLAAIGAGDHREADVWRARALARAAAVGWTAALGSLVMGEAFRVLARDNEDYARGRTLDVIEPSSAAERIVDEVEVLVRVSGPSFDLGPTAPSCELLERFVHEKRGFLLLLSGDLPRARESYLRALEAVAGQVRGGIKVRLGLALVDYMESARTGSDATATREATERLGREAADAGIRDLAATAARNADVMAAGGRELEPYEIL